MVKLDFEGSFHDRAKNFDSNILHLSLQEGEFLNLTKKMRKRDQRKLSYDEVGSKKSFFWKYQHSFLHKKFSKNKDEVISGITVSFALIPDAIAFSLIASLSPIVGLRASFILGIITAIFGGRTGMISGAAGALAVVQGSVVLNHGEGFLYTVMIIAGGVQIIFGLVQAGKLISLISESVMIGFLNGLGIVIFLAQLNSFRQVCSEPNPNNCPFISDIKLLYMIIMVVGTFFFILLVPLIPKVGKHIPVSMIAIIICTLINYYGVKTKTVGDIANVKGSLGFSVPELQESFDFDLFMIMLVKGIEFAFIGLIESLLTAQLLNEVTKTECNLNQEAIG